MRKPGFCERSATIGAGLSFGALGLVLALNCDRQPPRTADEAQRTIDQTCRLWAATKGIRDVLIDERPHADAELVLDAGADR